MCELSADSLGCAAGDVVVCSTGLIGVPLPMEPIETGLPKLAGTLGPAGEVAAEAILTTDTVRKEAHERVELADGTAVTVGGMAKGAAMLAPSMATMLAVLTTDAVVGSDALLASCGPPCFVPTRRRAGELRGPASKMRPEISTPCGFSTVIGTTPFRASIVAIPSPRTIVSGRFTRIVSLTG